MSTTTPEPTDTETVASDYYNPCTAKANILLSVYSGVTVNCQNIKGEHNEHFGYMRSEKPTEATDKKFWNAVDALIRFSWAGEYEG